jgi:hypothetical protein
MSKRIAQHAIGETERDSFDYQLAIRPILTRITNRPIYSMPLSIREMWVHDAAVYMLIYKQCGYISC